MRHWREGTKTSSKGGSGRAETDGLTISPLINTDRKGGAFRIMHQQFRRAIGYRMCDSKRTCQAHTWKATLCEGDKGRSGEREQITSQRQQVGTKAAFFGAAQTSDIPTPS